MPGQLKFGIPGALGFVSETTKERARASVSKAIRRGDLTRPKKCDNCGKGRRKILAHHDDYNKPLDVRWVCTGCHGKIHRFDHRNPRRRKSGKRVMVNLSPAEYKHVMAHGRAMFGEHPKGATLLRMMLLTMIDFDPELCGK